MSQTQSSTSSTNAASVSKSGRTAGQKDMILLGIVKELTEKEGKTEVKFPEVAAAFGDYTAISAIFMRCGQKNFLTIRVEDKMTYVSLTAQGREALANPKNAVVAGSPGGKGGNTGPRPEHLPEISDEDWYQARMAKFQADWVWQMADQRKHPFSDVARIKVANAEKKYKSVQAEYQKFLAGEPTAEGGETEVVEETTEESEPTTAIRRSVEDELSIAADKQLNQEYIQALLDRRDKLSDEQKDQLDDYSPTPKLGEEYTDEELETYEQALDLVESV